MVKEVHASAQRDLALCVCAKQTHTFVAVNWNMEFETPAELIRNVVKVARAYPYQVSGTIPERKDPTAVDHKLTELYETELTKAERLKRRRRGWANVLYYRCG